MFTTINTRISGSAFPIVVDLTDDILALPGLVSWWAPQASTLTLDGDGRVDQWRSMVPTALPLNSRDGANKPLWSANASGARGLDFVTALAEVLDWQGALPFGAGSAFTVFVIASLPATGSFVYIAGFDSTSAPNRNVLSYNTSTLRAIIASAEPNADISWAGPAGNTELVGWSYDDTANRLSVYGDETVVTVVNAITLAQGDFSVGHTANVDRRPTMMVHDIFVFNSDVLANASDAPALLQLYADSYAG